MKRFVSMSAVCVMLSVGASLPRADDGDSATVQPQASDLFEQLDRNGDGKLVRDELSSEQQRFFERLVRIGDQDGNGELTRAEFSTATGPTADQPQPISGPAGRGGQPGGRIPNPQDIMKQFDRNQDGKLSREEMPEAMRERLGRFLEQSGRDGLTLEDFERLRQSFAGRPQPQPGPEPRPGARPETPATHDMGSATASSTGGLFDRFDANKDGRVTVNEVPEAARRMVEVALERVGKGRDGALTREDLARLSVQAAQIGSSDSDSTNGPRPQVSGVASPEASRPETNRPETNRSETNRPTPDMPVAPRTSSSGRPPGGMPASGFFLLLDANEDGRLDRAELSRAAVLIERLDRNNDGAVDRQELFGLPGARDGAMRPDDQRRPAQETPVGSARPRRPDADRPNADRPDADRSDRRAPQATSAPATPAGPAATTGEPRRPSPPRQQDIEENFRRMDRNNDGAIDQNEAPERLKDNFNRIDLNKDGRLTLTELQQLLQRRGQK